MQNKIKQSETRVIKRSEITPAPYNPRTITDEARKALKKNIKKNGIIGGMVWNEETTNLVSGHQKLSIADEVNKYNPTTGENDYDIKVEVINVDLKTEKELNIFFNSKSVQGEMNYAKLAVLLPDIDVDLAGLDDVDLSLIDLELPKDVNIEIPTFEPQAEKKEEAQQLQEEEDAEDQASYEERKAKIKEIKSQVNEGAIVEGEPYLILSFDGYENKMFFLERFGLDDTKFIKGEEFAEMLDQ
ncbi:DNA methylase [Ornithobacterium rhinotracheale]|uniref:DNA methylase n=1 Tax=Ornithobacterium rhinotracheale TaxID=28251 RepID=UPI001FF31A83|nr:DNA methylase [Ornithobacterium rhinotracheale]MCK0201355.1 DNA methylase [Ornithobacterium rhinotracheale]